MASSHHQATWLIAIVLESITNSILPRIAFSNKLIVLFLDTLSVTLLRSQETSIVVTGLKWISDSFSVAFPEYMPLMVLHDPPGGWCRTSILFELNILLRFCRVSKPIQ